MPVNSRYLQAATLPDASELALGFLARDGARDSNAKNPIQDQQYPALFIKRCGG